VNKYALAGMFSLAFAVTAQGADSQYSDPGTPSGPKTSWYIGAGFGASWASIPDQTIDGINAVLLPNVPGATFSVINKDKHSGVGEGLIGYSFNRYFAVEGGYVSLGNAKADIDFRGGLVSVGTFNMKYNMSATFIDAVGLFPLSEKWSVLGRVGAAYSRVHADFEGEPITFAVSTNDQTEVKILPKFGAGVDYRANPSFTIRAEWERYKMPDPFSEEKFNVDAATLVLLYHF
jgi:OOP family OmpA-OmpF porin